MKNELNSILQAAKKEIDSASSLAQLNELKVNYLGKKGEITTLLRQMGSLSPEERPVMGKLANEVKEEIQSLTEKKEDYLKQKELEDKLLKESIDITLPGTGRNIGGLNPLTIVKRAMEETFISMGYEIVEGPEIENEFYNFEALNLPATHPARDMQDTFYITDEFLLRTHTSPVQVRTMLKKEGKLPVKIVSPGRVFRKDDDPTHSPVFQQLEGLVVDENITMADLKGTLLLFAQKMFGKDKKIRLRPSYFPFTEPSAEVDISCIMCDGDGCGTCSQTGWVEILGAGMVHPNVLKNAGYDPNKVQGFAFGIGIERVAMLKYGVKDIRDFYSGDIRVSKQFIGG
ncbi:phenylalanine--tRNA ligase subunit alpha [Proteinivorax hydrogeniformans]|uniref:Phenylalanine--tRNA ligase alpha subunit n=1 Tax=Proteinivorax hydrogeniformans TaxID=1826727 RepID=A0AAU8HRQ2_9FIRM